MGMGAIRGGFPAFSLLGVFLLSAEGAGAQASGATYTSGQANAGAAVYQARCAMCHLPTLQGSPIAPALAGPVFQNEWGARPVAQLMSHITATMPPTAAGTLTPQEVTVVVAYLLRANLVAPGASALSPESTGQVIPGFIPPPSPSVAQDPPTPAPMGAPVVPGAGPAAGSPPATPVPDRPDPGGPVLGDR